MSVHAALARRGRSGPRRPGHLRWLSVRTSAAREGERSKLRYRSWRWPTSPREEGSAGEHGAILPRRYDRRPPAAPSSRRVIIVETSAVGRATVVVPVPD